MTNPSNEEVVVSNLHHPQAPASGEVEWPAPKVTNTDIPVPTGVPYLDCLLHRMMDAQQDVNLASNEGMNQSLADAASLYDEIETAIRKCAALSPSQPASGEREEIIKLALEICDEVKTESGRHEAFARRTGDHDGAKRASTNASCADRIKERIQMKFEQSGIDTPTCSPPRHAPLAEGQERDAERWRALMASDRIKIWGWAGYGDASREPSKDGYRHFGGEFWTKHTAKDNPECKQITEHGREILTGYADALRALGSEVKS